MSMKLPLGAAAVPLLLGANPTGALPNTPQDSRALDFLTQIPQTRPLDPNGVDVYGELPYMRRAYAVTQNGQIFNGTGEAAYYVKRKFGGG